eukprot:16447980-Heterocapsa_arctica.AAC.1
MEDTMNEASFIDSLAKLLPTSMFSPAYVAAKAARLYSGDSGMVGPEDVDGWLDAIVSAPDCKLRAYG